MFTLIDVTEVAARPDDGVYNMIIKFDLNGELMEGSFGYHPDDTAESTTQIKQWLIDHEGKYEILPYVAPTADEIRAAMPSLSRVAFRTAFKNNGMTTAKINDAIEAITDESLQEDFQIIWEDAQTFGRLDPFVLMVAEFAGKTPEDIDTIWTTKH